MKKLFVVYHFEVEKCGYNWEKLKCSEGCSSCPLQGIFKKDIEDLGVNLINFNIGSDKQGNFSDKCKKLILDYINKNCGSTDDCIALLHGRKEPFSGKSDPVLKPGILLLVFSSGQGFVYEQVNEELGIIKNNGCFNFGKIDSEWWERVKNEVKKNSSRYQITTILLFFTPLHLSLQAFWGVAVKEVPEDLSQPIEFVKIGTRKEEGDKYLGHINIQRKKLKLGDVNKEIKEEYQKLFPNPDAFLLVKEAEYDFYAPLINFIIDGKKGIAKGKKENCSEEKDIYQMPTLKKVIEEVEKQIGNKNGFFAGLKNALQNSNTTPCNPNINNGSWTYNSKEFISCLREICAILANTCEKCQKDRKYFGYKGKNKKQNRERKDKGINNILSSLGKNFKEPHCKLEEFEGRDKVLIKQLTDWSIEKALVVIAGIEVLGRELSNLLV